jgi:enterochelin esterase-like enzyme
MRQARERIMTTARGCVAGAAVALSVWLCAMPMAAAQAPGRGALPSVKSPEVLADRRVTFRIAAPEATKVELRSPGDIPGSIGRGVIAPMALTRNAEGVWEINVGPLPAGAYRYVFAVNGVVVVDSRNPMTSQTNATVYSLAVVPGSEFFDTRPVPHGAVASIHYQSTALGGIRRMHVYTPPGYETSRDRYPVLYLLHGAGDVDESWSTVGRAGFILDNLIAARKAKPMLVVMPAGHVNGAGAALGAPAASGPGNPGLGSGPDPFVDDFLADLMPYVEKTYRVLTDRQDRAIAGLSMGGFQTLNIAVPHLDRFAYIGVFSSGILDGVGARGAAPPAQFAEGWEKRNLASLDNTAARSGVRLLWFGTGKDDFLIETTKSSVALMKRHGFAPVFVESEGGHTWLNWRDYLSEFAPQLFR